MEQGVMDDTEPELNTAAKDDGRSEPIQLAEIFHRSLPDPRGVLTAVGFLNSNRKCFNLIREAMLRHNWQEAANYFSCFIQTLTGILPKVRTADSEIVWRVGTEILHHLPNSSPDDFNTLYEQLKNFGVTNYTKICLEHSFYLLLNKQMDEAKRQLAVADCWRFGKHSTAQFLMKNLIRGYCGYLDYLIWSQKRPSAHSSVVTEEASNNLEMHSYFRQASVTLKEIVSQPGIWDTFILSYVDMLEFYEHKKTALQVLENYAYNKKFPLNPNAHVYLYQFLKRHQAPKSKLINSLKILHSLVPSHELMLELCLLLLSTKKKKRLKEALAISMDLLEFSSWKCDIKAWKCLLQIMQELKEKECLKAVRKEWKVRGTLWRSLHYRRYISKRDALQNPQLLIVKRDVLRFTGKRNQAFIRLVMQFKRDGTLKKK